MTSHSPSVSPHRVLVRAAALTLTAALVFLGPLPAQDRGERIGSDDDVLIRERTHSRSRSLSLFQACDLNADDRLDILEFQRAFRVLGKARAERFSALDSTRNGHLSWPEFDAHYRAEIARLSEFRLYPPREPRPIDDPAAPDLEIDPALLLIRGHDLNRDRVLQEFEFRGFLRNSNLPASLADQFGTLDQNGNGKLEPAEFRPVALQLPGIVQKFANTPDPRSSLPADDRAADRNLDGVIDRLELEDALRAIHPRLGRLTIVVLQGANATLDRNPQLGGSELIAARRRARAWLESRAEALRDSAR